MWKRMLPVALAVLLLALGPVDWSRSHPHGRPVAASSSASAAAAPTRSGPCHHRRPAVPFPHHTAGSRARPAAAAATSATSPASDLRTALRMLAQDSAASGP